MLNHKFSVRETILLLVCAVVALGIFYYEFAFKTFQMTEKQYDTSELETQLTLVQAQAANQKNMEAYIEEHKNDYVGEIAVYNNLSQEVSEIGNVLEGKADNISITWNEPTLTDTTVRRTANISFKADNYDTVKGLIYSIHSLKYRCTIQDVSIDAGSDSTLSSSDSINVSLSVTFYETTEGATSTSGLTVTQDDSSSSEEDNTFKGDATYN